MSDIGDIKDVTPRVVQSSASVTLSSLVVLAVIFGGIVYFNRK